MPPLRSWSRLVPLVVLVLAAVAAGAAMLSPGVSTTAAPVTFVKVVNTFPHDRTSFCQGLVMLNGAILEGTGQYNRSRLRLVDLPTGKPTMDVALPGNVFGEGVTVWKNTILQLTWKNGYLLTYDSTTLRRTGSVQYRQIDRGLYEGWGITHDGTHLIISDGSSTLRFVDPETFKTVRRLRVKDGFRGVSKLNELEFVNGEILANVWYRDRIARIDPKSGRVAGWLDLRALRPASLRNDREAVLNGIAWDAAGQRLFVTGKNWPTLLEISY
ncbi:MAG: glutaminyl-peptide cyclotransferase [Fuerstiella sp.]